MKIDCDNLIMMKKILLSLCLLISGLTLAQSNLPPCNGDYYGPCFGSKTYSGGEKYIGEWFNDQKNGQGKYIWPDGENYVGQFKDGLYHGQGTYTYVNGDKYVGQFKDDVSHGQGSYTFADGRKYVGQYRNDKRNGQGIYSWPDGDKYIGQFKDGKMHGQGTYTFADGRKYVGQWLNDKRNGQGTFFLANGTISQEGIWSDGKFVQAQSITPTIVPVVPKPPAITSNPQEIKRQKCIRLGLAPGSTDFQQCMN